MLQIKNLSVTYGRAVTAVSGLSLEVPDASLVALIGQNGAGKSSTLRAICGLANTPVGRIEWDGEPIRRNPVLDHIAYVPDNRGIFTTLTVEENLRIGAVSRRDNAAVRDDIERELNRFPILRKYFKRGASVLSGGEQQMLAISRALLLNPRLLLLDEPSLGLAPLIVDQIFDTLDDLRGNGMTILLVEQNAVRAMALADTSYVIAPPGRLVGKGSTAELAEQDAVVEYLGFVPDGSR